MILSEKSTLFAPPAKVVGTLHTLAGLRLAQKCTARDLDLLELRADAFADSPECLPPLLRRLKRPLILTVRHPHEGAVQPVSLKKRTEIFLSLLPFATLIDVELRSAVQLAPILREARAQGVKIILSHHDFKKTPPLKRLQELARQAQRAGADLFKAATVASTPDDVATLLDFLRKEKSLPLCVMGMGPFGKVSRLLLAQAGSRLVYGYLDRAQLAGQWPASLLKKRIEELTD